ncbi:SIMPL domain-containing protein [Sphingomonas sp. KR1UV-12]|uniref:SIMPL domain-containing protein n=1 Tax=Sphingomonas aurea TaxID=3063994 RepID=A0ABT9EMZ5_9SPHN|nr:SIMPL domain-containing protein [Sphingomonas sp. KR1UV-12]MDP1028330.1 SIMPL domain-containing protein [Sphingomonas sp. KR1UV-12]
MRHAVLAILTATAVLPAVAAAQTGPASVVPMVAAAGTVLDVVAEGKTTRVPDLATIRAGVVSTAPTAAQALGDNAASMTKVMAALRRAGVAARDLTTATVQLSPQYRYADNQPPVVTGYQATNTVSIRFRDVATSGAILDALVAQGANQIDGPNLSVAEPEAALDEARTDALRRARARADLYAKAAGLRVVRIVSIGEAGQDAGGPDRPPVFYARAMAADAKTVVAPGEKDITATLQVRFLLDQ